MPVSLSGGKKVGIAQLEIISAEKLVDERGNEIVEVLEKLKRDFGLDHVFQNTIELVDEKNYFVTSDGEMQKVLEKVLEVRFSGAVAERSGMIMRKQIVPLLKEELEK